MNPYKEKLIRHRNYLGKGMAEIYAFRAIIMFVSAAGIFLKYLIKIELPVWVYITAGLLMAISCWVIGYIWDRYSLYDVEAEFANKRNPAIRKLLRRR